MTETERHKLRTTPPDRSAPPVVRKHRSESVGLRWEDISVLQYKETGSNFKNITRQILFGEETGLDTELRYFEIWPGGHSSLERHDHVHAVIVLSGRGRAVVGDDIHELRPFDLVHVPAAAWHQFQAAPDEHLGFLCLVSCERDRPHRPSAEEADALRSHPVVGRLIKI